MEEGVIAKEPLPDELWAPIEPLLSPEPPRTTSAILGT
jgi:transposase